jgi:hypothetical protein
MALLPSSNDAWVQDSITHCELTLRSNSHKSGDKFRHTNIEKDDGTSAFGEKDFNTVSILEHTQDSAFQLSAKRQRRSRQNQEKNHAKKQKTIVPHDMRARTMRLTFSFLSRQLVE